MARLFLFFLLSLVSIIQAVDVTGRIQWNTHCPGPKDLGSARVVLDSGKLSAGVVANGTFTIYDVPQGVYILSVSSHDHTFDQLRLDVSEDTVEARPYAPATPLNPASPTVFAYPLVLIPRGKLTYFVPHESFNLLAMLKSPMVLMMVFTGGMVLAMPYLMKNMDPESLEELKEQQAKMAKMQSAITSGDFKSGLTAMMGSEEPKEAPAASSSSRSSPAAAAKGKGKKRR